MLGTSTPRPALGTIYVKYVGQAHGSVLESRIKYGIDLLRFAMNLMTVQES